MAVFDYKARDSEAQLINGAVVAASENVAYDTLKERGLTIISLDERKEGKMMQNPLNVFNRVKSKELVIFARQLAVMINANVPIVRSLKILLRQTENVKFKVILSDVLDEVEGGAKLSASLQKHPNVFNNFFVFMVRSGETTGKLDEVLEYLATQKEKDYDLVSKVRGAMTYPIVLLGGVLVVGIGLTLFVLPSLLDVFAQGGAELPLPTRILIAFVNFTKTYWYVIFLGLGALIVGFMMFKKTKRGKRVWDLTKVKMPLFGGIFRKLYLSRMARSIATLLAAGVPISRALEITGDVVDNCAYREIISETISEVEGGNSITTAFVKSKYVPLMMSQMMAIGEQSGRMDQILGKVADFFDRELENVIANLVTLMEPVILMIMGGAVGFLVAAILLPIYNLSSAI